mmetsp:Transcript_41998/g.136759  ORF Transcript_41998/g.136759 Transcript_41998/m.136759 type:complete len:475 (+) Transcript_41998:14-1438(+)
MRVVGRFLCCLHKSFLPGEPERPFVVLEVATYQAYSLGRTRFVALDPDGKHPDQAFVERCRREFAGYVWNYFVDAVVQVHRRVLSSTAVKPPTQTLTNVPFHEYVSYVIPRVGCEEFAGTAEDFFAAVGTETAGAYPPSLPRSAISRSLALVPVEMGSWHSTLASELRGGRWLPILQCLPLFTLTLPRSECERLLSQEAARGGRDACEPSASGGGETQADLARRERNWAQRLKSKERKAAKVANLPAEERYVPSTLKTDQLLFVKPATAPTPAVHRGPQPPQLTNPCAPWGGLPVVIRHIEKNGPPPRSGADPTYLFVESVVPGGPAWRVHRSQALSFTNTVEPRWNRLEAERDEGRAGSASELLELRLGLVHAVAREVVRDARGGNAEARLKQLFPARWRAHTEARKLQPGWETLPRGLPPLLAELSEEIKQLPTQPGPSSGALPEAPGGDGAENPHPIWARGSKRERPPPHM